VVAGRERYAAESGVYARDGNAIGGNAREPGPVAGSHAMSHEQGKGLQCQAAEPMSPQESVIWQSEASGWKEIGGA